MSGPLGHGMTPTEERSRETDETPAARGKRARGMWSWAFASQGVSSATSLALSVLAGRVLGANGLGIVFAGFTACILLLALHRALVTTPLISTSTVLSEPERVLATRTALPATLAAGVLGAAILLLLGLTVGGPVGHGTLVFAPWLVAVFSQQLFRSSLIRDGRGRQAATTDIAWLGVLILCAPVAARIDEVWAVVAAWGVGGVVAASIGAAWMWAWPTSVSISRSWFVGVALPFGRWLALQEGSFTVGFYALVVILTAVLGAPDVGGMRAADSIFAPFTLLAPALVLAGLPATSRALARSRASAVDLAVRISGTCVILTVAYAALMLFAGSRILTVVFGEEFRPYGDLVTPMSVWQVALATGIGFTILLYAEQRGTAILGIGTIMIAVTLAASTLLATVGGVQGAVWGLAVGAAVGSCLLFYFGLRRARAAGSPTASAAAVTSPTSTG